MRKQEYINGLEGRAQEYSNKNKLLRENVALLRKEVLELKSEVLRHAGCGFWPIEEYLAQCVDDLLGTKAAASMPGSGKGSQTHSSGSMASLHPARGGDMTGNANRHSEWKEPVSQMAVQPIGPMFASS